MPSAVSPEPLPLPKWKRPAKTNEELDWADIKVIDLSTFDEPGAKQRLAEELRDAVSWAMSGHDGAKLMNGRSIGRASFPSLVQDLRRKRWIASMISDSRT